MPRRIADPSPAQVKRAELQTPSPSKAAEAAPTKSNGWAPKPAALNQLNQLHGRDRDAGWKNAPGKFVMDAVSKKGKTFDRDVSEANAYFRTAAADGVIDLGEQGRLDKLVSSAATDGAAYEKTRHQVAQVTATVATTAVAVGVTVATAGAGAPLIAVALAGGVAGAGSQVLAKGAIEGQSYTRKEASRDALLGGIQGAATVVTGGLGGKVASAALRSSAAGAIESKLALNVGAHVIEGGVNGALGGAIGGAASTSLADGNWKDGVSKGLEHVGKSAAQGAAIGGVIGGAVSGAGALIQSTHAAPTPLADGPKDLSNYRSTAQARRGVRELLGDRAEDSQKLVATIKAQHPELAKIPDEDLMGLRLYTEEARGIGYREQNLALRGRTGDLNRLTPAVETAASALDRMPSYQGTVYRGTTLSADALSKYQPGQVLTERSFLSTTQDVNVASHWREANTSFVINSTHNGKAIAAVSQFQKEAEVLFTPGTQFKILSHEVDQVTGHHTIFLNEVP